MTLPPWVPLLNSSFPCLPGLQWFPTASRHTHSQCTLRWRQIQNAPWKLSRCQHRQCSGDVWTQCLGTTMGMHKGRTSRRSLLKDTLVITLQRAPAHLISTSPITRQEALFVSQVHSAAASGDMLPSVAAEWDSLSLRCITFTSFPHRQHNVSNQIWLTQMKDTFGLKECLGFTQATWGCGLSGRNS